MALCYVLLRCAALGRCQNVNLNLILTRDWRQAARLDHGRISLCGAQELRDRIGPVADGELAPGVARRRQRVRPERGHLPAAQRGVTIFHGAALTRRPCMGQMRSKPLHGQAQQAALVSVRTCRLLYDCLSSHTREAADLVSEHSYKA